MRLYKEILNVLVHQFSKKLQKIFLIIINESSKTLDFTDIQFLYYINYINYIPLHY